MKTANLFRAILFLCIATNIQAQTVGVWYQPTPTPPNKVPHSVCGWLGSYYYRNFQFNTTLLETGGWVDWYKIYCKFDMEGMPQNVINASLDFKPYGRGDNSTPVGITWYSVNSSWDGSTLTWDNQPPLTSLGDTRVTPVAGQWWGGNIAAVYNNWASSVANSFNSTTSSYPDWRRVTTTNNGVMLAAQGNNNNFDMFRSTNYSNDADRPAWWIEFPRPYNEPDLKMPLPGGRAYKITSEIGGYDCAGNGDTGHQDLYNSGSPAFNYFALDIIGPINSYFTSTPNGKVPILASAAGKVDFTGTNASNGNYMVIRHYINGVDTRYSTLYLHMDAVPTRANGVLWKVGDQINQGDRIGFMGNTGNSYGTHLHFAVRYGDASPPVAGTTRSGAKNIPQLTNATMEGFIFKSYQTDCGMSGAVNVRQYGSSNIWYQ